MPGPMELDALTWVHGATTLGPVPGAAQETLEGDRGSGCLATSPAPPPPGGKEGTCNVEGYTPHSRMEYS